MEGGKNGPAQSFPTPLLRRNVQLAKANKKNTCFPGSPTDHNNSGPTLNFFSKKKNPIFRITNLLEN